MDGEVAAIGEALAEEGVGVLVGAALPRHRGPAKKTPPVRTRAILMVGGLHPEILGRR